MLSKMNTPAQTAVISTVATEWNLRRRADAQVEALDFVWRHSRMHEMAGFLAAHPLSKSAAFTPGAIALYDEDRGCARALTLQFLQQRSRKIEACQALAERHPVTKAALANLGGIALTAVTVGLWLSASQEQELSPYHTALILLMAAWVVAAGKSAIEDEQRLRNRLDRATKMVAELDSQGLNAVKAKIVQL